MGFIAFLFIFIFISLIISTSHSSNIYKLKRDKYMNTMSNYFFFKERIESKPSTLYKKLENYLISNDTCIKTNDSIEIFNEILDSGLGFNTIISVPNFKAYSEVNNYVSTISHNSTVVMASNLKYQHLDILDKIYPKNNLYFLKIESYRDLEGLDKRLKAIINSNNNIRIYSFLRKD